MVETPALVRKGPAQGFTVVMEHIFNSSRYLHGLLCAIGLVGWQYSGLAIMCAHCYWKVRTPQRPEIERCHTPLPPHLPTDHTRPQYHSYPGYLSPYHLSKSRHSYPCRRPLTVELQGRLASQVHSGAAPLQTSCPLEVSAGAVHPPQHRRVPSCTRNLIERVVYASSTKPLRTCPGCCEETLC